MIQYALRGVDIVFYDVFRSLGLKTSLRPLLDGSKVDDLHKYAYEREFEFYLENPDLYDGGFSEDEDCTCGGCILPSFPSFEEWKAMRPSGAWIGTKFHGVTFVHGDDGEDMRLVASGHELLDIDQKISVSNSR